MQFLCWHRRPPPWRDISCALDRPPVVPCQVKTSVVRELAECAPPYSPLPPVICRVATLTVVCECRARFWTLVIRVSGGCELREFQHRAHSTLHSQGDVFGLLPLRADAASAGVTRERPTCIGNPRWNACCVIRCGAEDRVCACSVPCIPASRPVVTSPNVQPQRSGEPCRRR